MGSGLTSFQLGYTHSYTACRKKTLRADELEGAFGLAILGSGFRKNHNLGEVARISYSTTVQSEKV